MPITDEDIAAAKAANPGAQLVQVSYADLGADFVIKTPSQAEYGAQRAAEAAANDPYNVALGFVLRHVVKPDLPETQRLIGTYPALCEKLNFRLMEAAGSRAEAVVKKL